MLNIIEHGPVREINMARPPVNALSLELLQALRGAVESGVHDGVRGIVLSGASGIYSAGVDIPTLLGKDRRGVREYWGELFALCATLARAPIPLAAAVTGHAPAGGAVLALFCDYRVMAEGAFKIGLNEVQVGLLVPECIQLALRRVIGRHRAERLLVAGTMLEADAALTCGFVDELVPVEQVVARTTQWLEALLALPAAAMLATRELARADLADAYADLDALPLDAFTDAFFLPQTQATLQQWMAARSKPKH
ncbi:MAG TPA: enoyl-CoA hydratase/isomerase family protein [Rhodanobacter sp.]|nr:enoyl-CoA hydratase/isomerase family protein [Rhodanobacter sp.]